MVLDPFVDNPTKEMQHEVWRLLDTTRFAHRIQTGIVASFVKVNGNAIFSGWYSPGDVLVPQMCELTYLGEFCRVEFRAITQVTSIARLSAGFSVDGIYSDYVHKLRSGQTQRLLDALLSNQVLSTHKKIFDLVTLAGMKGGDGIKLKLTSRYISQLTGISRRQCNRIITSYQQSGIITAKVSDSIVFDTEKLCKLSEHQPENSNG